MSGMLGFEAPHRITTRDIRVNRDLVIATDPTRSGKLTVTSMLRDAGTVLEIVPAELEWIKGITVSTESNGHVAVAVVFDIPEAAGRS